MKKYITLDRIIMIIIIIILLLIGHSDKRDYSSILTKQKIENQKLDSIKNIYGKTILTQDIIITSNKNVIKELSDSVFNLKKKNDKKVKEVIAFYSNISNTQIKNKTIPYKKDDYMKKFADSIESKCADVLKFYRDSSVQLPKSIKDSSEDFVFDATLKKDSLVLNTLSFPDSQYIRVDLVKKGFLNLGKPQYEIKMFHTNKYVTNKGLTSIMYKPKKKNNLVFYGILVGIGLILGHEIR